MKKQTKLHGWLRAHKTAATPFAGFFHTVYLVTVVDKARHIAGE